MSWTDGELPPPDEAPPLEWLLYEQARVLRRQQALTHLSPAALRHQVESGRWCRPLPGIYVAHNGQFTREQRWWIAVLANGAQAVLGGPTAAIAGGLRWGEGSAVHVLIPAQRRTQQPGRSILVAPDLPRIVVHRSSQLPAKDVMERARPPRTMMARSVVDAAQWAPTADAARALVAAACRQRLTTPDELFDVAARMPRARNRSLLLETIGYTASGAEALSEISLIRLCRRARLPPPDQQHARRDARGRLRYLDNRWPHFGVAAEVDGSWHTDPAEWWADMWRQNDLWIGDEIVLRFPAWALRHREEQVAAQLARALIHGGWPPTAPWRG